MIQRQTCSARSRRCSSARGARFWLTLYCDLAASLGLNSLLHGLREKIDGINDVKYDAYDITVRAKFQNYAGKVQLYSNEIKIRTLMPGCTIHVASFPARVQRITIQRSHAGIIVRARREPGNEATQMLLEEASTRSGTIGFAPEKYNEPQLFR